VQAMNQLASEIVKIAEPLETLGPNGRIGLVALATDLCSESDLRSMLPPGVELYTNRVANINPTTVENLRAMMPDIGRAASGIVPDVELDAMIYGCTSGTVVNGEEAVIRALQSARGNVPCTTPITAALAAIQSFSARRISVLTPYLQSVNAEVGAYFQSRGLDLVNITGFDFASDADMTAISPESIYRAAVEVCRSEADLLFISCTALRASGVVERLERALNKPVVTSNQALVWHVLELIGKPYSVSGFGSLFSRRLAAVA
jgi:maleate isomerase